jgi:hypothetical protein
MNAATFTPTHEWQDVPPDAVLPPGLEIELNMDSGTQRARLPRTGNGHDAERLADLDRAYAEDAGETTAQPYKYTLLRDLEPNLKANEIVRGIIPRRSFGEVHADPGGGKTAILVDLLLHVAAGMEYRSRRVAMQPVVYVALEGHAGIGNRIIAASKEIGVEDAPFALVLSADNFRDPEAAKRVASICKELTDQFGGDSPIVAIDTYTAALGGGSDCDPKDVGAFIANIQRHLLVHATVILAHHFGKDSSRGARGWSGLNAALDFELEIDRDGDLRTMQVTKARDGSDSQPACCYRLVGRELGVNEHGEPVTAVVVEHLADEDTTKPGKRLSPKARAAMNELWAMIKDKSRSFPMADQPGLRCVLATAWETACIAPGVVSQCKEERDRRKQFRAAREELEAGKSITCEGGNLGRVFPTAGNSAKDRED